MGSRRDSSRGAGRRTSPFPLVHIDGFGIDEFDPALGGQGEAKLLAVDGSQMDEDLADQTALLALDLQRLLDLTLPDELHELEHLAQRLAPALLKIAHADLLRDSTLPSRFRTGFGLPIYSHVRACVLGLLLLLGLPLFAQEKE